MKYTRMMSKR